MARKLGISVRTMHDVVRRYRGMSLHRYLRLRRLWLVRQRLLAGADRFVFVTGEYNWGIQPGLKNLTDHFLEEWFWRPAAIVSYSAGRLSGARASTAWHGTLSEMGMVVVSSTIGVGPIAQTLSAESEPIGEGGKALERSFPRFADDLMWWIEAAKAPRAPKAAPY